MKRNLFTVAAGLLIGFGAVAQVDLPEGTSLVTRGLWSVLDASENGKAIMLTNDLIGGGFEYDTWQGDIYGGTVWSADGTELTMKFNGSGIPAGDALNWSSVVLNFQTWDGQTEDEDPSNDLTDKFYSYNAQRQDTLTEPLEKFTEKPMITRGYTVDFSNPTNAYLSFDYELEASEAAVSVQFDLIDILGRRANSSAQRPLSRAVGTISTGSGKITVTWDPDAADYDITAAAETDEDGQIYPELSEDGKLELFCKYSPDYHGIGNPAEGLDPLENRGDAEIAVERICGVAIAIYPDESQSTNTATLKISNIKLGAGAVLTPSGFKTAEGAELEVIGGVVYSAGKIVVTSITGQVVAIANGEFDTKSLKAGVYLIKAAEGTAKIVK